MKITGRYPFLIHLALLYFALISRQILAEFQLHTGVLLNFINLHPAETVYPIKFDIELPEFQKIPTYHIANGSESDREDIFQLASAINTSDMALQDLVEFYWETENSQFSMRIPRGLDIIGNFMSWCCNLATHQEIFPYGTTARDTFKGLNSQVSAAFQKVANNNIKIGNYSTAVRQFLVKMTDSISTIIDAVNTGHDRLVLENLLALYKKDLAIEYSLINVINAQKFHEIISDCAENRLSPLAITPKKLKSALQVLQQQLRGQNFALAIPFSQITEYYANPLAKCSRSDIILDVHLKIPLVSTKITWQFIQFKSLAFAHNSQTCRISVMEEVAVGSTRDKAAAHLFKFERRVTDTIALISDSPLQTKSAACVRALISPRITLEALKYACPFHCVPTQDLVIQKIEDRTFVLTNPLALSVNCNGNVSTLPHANAAKGAIQVTIPCNCSLHSPSETLIRTVFPCFSSHTEARLINMIPNQWTRLPDSIYVAQISSFPNLSAILHENWADELPPVLQLDSPNITSFDWDFSVKTFTATSSIIHWLILILLAVYILGQQRQAHQSQTPPKIETHINITSEPQAKPVDEGKSDLVELGELQDTEEIYTKVPFFHSPQ